MSRYGLLMACLLGTVGCGGEGRAPVPPLDPGRAAELALQELDANRDGFLTKDEIAGCPGMLAALSVYDGNGDGKLTREEIAARLQSWFAKKVGLMSFRAAVTYQGKPLGDAKVVLRPEKLLDGAIKPASGTSDANGIVAFQVEDADLHGGMQILQPGLYRVEVTHPTRPINAKYRASLGIEATPDYLVGKNITFDVGP
jgi:hypothetical protein